MNQGVKPAPGYLHEADSAQWQKPITISHLTALHSRGEKIAVLTCYDASFAALLNQCGVEVLLVGDSLGMVCQGHSSTLLMADLPAGGFASPAETYRQATTLMQAGAHMVKLEGGGWQADTVHFLTQRGIPVCGHLGLMPQSIHQLGGYKIQGKTIESAAALKADASALQAAGAAMLLLEAIPSALGQQVTQALSIPTIGIGAGPDCSGQVLVLHDLLDVFPGQKPRFVKNFMAGQSSIQAAITDYVAAVKAKTFPAAEHCF